MSIDTLGISLLHHFDSFAHTASPVAVAGLWQGFVLALALALCLAGARRISAAHRFLLWFAAFAVIAALPFVENLIPVLDAVGAAHPATGSIPAAPHAWLRFDPRWTFAIAGLWLAASFARGADLALHIFRLRRLWKTARPIDIPLDAQSRTFEVCTTPSLDRPSVVGFFAPRVLIPDWLFERLTPGELQQIVLHESMHLLRHDDWSNLFQKLCLVLFPLNPALWLLDRRLDKEREMACDEAVVRITHAPRAYAACLASIAERGIARRSEALSLGAFHRRSELVDRVHRILRGHRGLSPAAARLLVGALGCSLAVITVELARCPQLVAFAPAAHGASVIHGTAAELGDAVYPTNPRREMLPSGSHIVQARAIMPAASNAKPFAARAHARPSAVGELRASAEPGPFKPGPLPREARLSAVQPGVAALAPSGDSQQVLVFTAWEQIETDAPEQRAVADRAVTDYDTPPPADAGSSKTTPPDNASPVSGARRTTFTQLILRVVPRGSTFQGSKSSQPAAIPIGEGWFVIQL